MGLADEAELERELDRLYELPLEEFTLARDELARRAREESARAIAARIKELRKPPVPAWVVNRLARERELDVQRLVKAGERLGAAQAEAVRAGGGDAFEEARREEQHALDRLAARAKEILEESGRGSGNLDRVLATLRAASLTEEGRELLKRGRLTEELEPPGFEALAGVQVPQRAKVPPKSSKRPTAEARARVRELRGQLRELESRARSADRQVAQAKKELKAAEAEAAAVDRERRRAQDELAAAERDLAELT